MYLVFGYGHVMPPVSVVVNPSYYFISLGVVVAVTLIAVFSLGMRLTNNAPADLLRPKPPKKGKRILLERIPFIWKRLSFRYKSSMRNVLSYKTRFLMMLVSIAVSTGLVFAGLALLDMCLFGDFGSPAIIGIAIVVVVFAGLLTAVVINTLTTIDISERERGIATLMVLGYHDGRNMRLYLPRNIYQRFLRNRPRLSRRNGTRNARIQNDRFRNGRKRQLVRVASGSARRTYVYVARHAYVKTENRQNENERKP